MLNCGGWKAFEFVGRGEWGGRGGVVVNSGHGNVEQAFVLGVGDSHRHRRDVRGVGFGEAVPHHSFREAAVRSARRELLHSAIPRAADRRARVCHRRRHPAAPLPEALRAARYGPPARRVLRAPRVGHGAARWPGRELWMFRLMDSHDPARGPHQEPRDAGPAGRALVPGGRGPVGAAQLRLHPAHLHGHRDGHVCLPALLPV